MLYCDDESERGTVAPGDSGMHVALSPAFEITTVMAWRLTVMG